jgi:hypothetical protein
MKSITFTVQIQADFPRRSRTPKAVALKLCDDINNILAQYDGVTGGAQIIPPPETSRSPRRWTTRPTKQNTTLPDSPAQHRAVGFKELINALLEM